MKADLEGTPLWVSVDETTDVAGRYFANVLIGKLDKEKSLSPILIACTFLENPDVAAIARLINWSLLDLWPNFDSNLLTVMLSDSADYMLKAGNNLKVFNPKMCHLTCLAHSLHKLAETVRELFPVVNHLISAVKKVVCKTPSRIATWKNNYPHLPLPPSPCGFYSKKL
ncbi:hypothetical protein TCAL_11636 [Tigriopus californicus]|uniref:Uncharacterized protein n=1 Tax=Tigriopus californicus TaxID=6832 RepID=A0A553PG05_TIGCA|nr:hypothetical protein TCAL_11636 [Tigriopus californicus]|eukprot:TCALIF_11636-PA protein Name:"Protein of unknown function" AED:0.21 eAED:0.24 QI:0/-1/0/1/-1/1/1/0/168